MTQATPEAPVGAPADWRAAPLKGSARARAAATVGSLTLKPATRVIDPEKAWGIFLSRQIVARTMDAFGPSLAGAQVEPVDTRLPDGRRVVGEWVRAKGVARTDAGIYYVHGSGYAMCSTRTHRRLTTWLSRLTGLPVFVVEYRIAPRHRFPAAANDVRAAWDWLQSTSEIPAERWVIAGDSAGGHLSVDLGLQLAEGDPRPAAMVMFSPVADLTFELAGTREQLRRDPAISAAGAARLVALYSNGIDPHDPRLKLDVIGGRPLPPTLIQVGGREMLAADAHQLAADIRVAGGTCELQVWPDQVHVFQALPKLTPEAEPAMAAVASFIAEQLDAPARHLQESETA